MKSIDEKLYEFLIRYEVFANEIIISNAGTIGKIAMIKHSNKNVILTENAVKLVPRDNTFNNQFLKIILNTSFVQKQMKQQYIQTTIPKLSIERINNLNIPILAWQDQLNIINIMDTAYDINKQKHKESKDILHSIDNYLLDSLGISLSRELKNNIEKRTFKISFSDVFAGRLDPEVYSTNFSFNTKKFMMVRFKEYVQIDPYTNFNKIDDLVTFIPMEKISDKYGQADLSLKRLSTESKGYTKFQNGDLLWSKITPCMENGKSAIVHNLYNNIGFGSTEFYVFRPLKDINIEYVHFLFRLESFRKNAKLFFTGSSGHQRVPKDYFLQLEIPLPPLNIQNEIAAELKLKRDKAKKLQLEAIKVLEDAKEKVEKIILGEEYES